jgi:exosome complex component RRP4
MYLKLKTLVANRQIVRPGDTLAILEEGVQGYRHLPDKHIYFYGNRILSDITGLAVINDNDIQVIPLEGKYIPRVDDVVIGIVKNIGLTSWTVDINSPYPGILNANDVIENFNPIKNDLKMYLDIGEYIIAKIVVFDRTRDPQLTIRGKGLGKITEGTVIEVKPSRVPRIIGKKGSMLNILTTLTGCNITVGQNGLIWIRCSDDETLDVLIRAIRRIEARSHIRGLTEEIRMFLEKNLGKG